MLQPDSAQTYLYPTVVQLSLALTDSLEGESFQPEPGNWPLVLERSPNDQTDNRVQQLERALDQALICLEELRQRLREQSLLETQLAVTEEFAGVQQQAIARLKVRIQHQRQVIQSYLKQMRQQDLLSQQRIVAAEALAQTQRAELEALRNSLASHHSTVTSEDSLLQLEILQTELQRSRQQVGQLEVEAQSAQALSERLQSHLEAAQQQIQDLSTVLDSYEARMAELEVELGHPLPPAPFPLPEGHSSREASSGIATLGRDLAKAQIKVEELEIELARQMRSQSLWQQNHRELEAECDRHRNRVAILEQQILELQEQVFQQARQSGEYEAAVQHWKDRYAANQRHLSNLKLSLENLQVQFPEADPELLSIVAQLAQGIDAPLADATASPDGIASSTATRLNSLDLPDFLLRRRGRR